MTHEFFITDVFAEGPYAGNQLATVMDAGDLTASEMQQIAREFNFAETSFCCGGDLANGFDVRIFTPMAELPFAGHPTLGTAFVLRQQFLNPDVAQLSLNLGVGQVPVTFDSDGLVWLRSPQPVFAPAPTAAQVAADMGISVAQLDPLFPPRKVSTGVEFLIVPLVSLEALQALDINSQRGALPVLAFCTGAQAPGQDIAARMFAPELGVVEDAATGSANSCLAAYLIKTDYFGGGAVGGQLDLRVGQGYQMGRPSQIHLRASLDTTAYNIHVGGRVQMMARGEWRS